MVLLAVAVALTVVMVQYAGRLPNELSFTDGKHRRTTTWPTPLVLGGLWMLCVALPLLAWYWFAKGSGRYSWSPGAFGSLAGLTTSAGIFAATFVVHHGAESANRARDGLLASAAGLAIGLMVHLLRPREHRADLIRDDDLLGQAGAHAANDGNDGNDGTDGRR